MDRGFQQAPASPVDGDTVLAQADGGARAKVCRPVPAIVAGSGPHLTAETQVLLRARLRAAAFILLVGFGVFLVRHVVGVILGELFAERARRPPPTVPFDDINLRPLARPASERGLP